MIISIFYVCTGRYSMFWEPFYASSERFFLPNHEKHYFIFTDNALAHADNPRVHCIEQQNLGWPNNTLLRYHMFLREISQFENSDFCFFFNGNAQFCAPVGDAFLPEDDRMLFVQHPGSIGQPRTDFTYETNPESRAYIAPTEGEFYVCGGVNGARTRTYIAFMRNIAAAVDEDSRKNIVAVWHDESHSNRYALDHPHILRDPSYCYPEGWALPFAPKVRILDKQRHGGHAYMRGQSDTPVSTPLPIVGTVLMGGLGNQMFQYAAGRALAFRLNAELLLDVSWFASQVGAAGTTPREFSLHVFPLMNAKCVPREVSYFRGKPKFHQRVKRRIQRVFARLLRTYTPEPPCVSDSDISNVVAFRRITAPCTLFGYWQKEEFFADADFLVREDFTFPSLPSGAQALVEHIASVQNSIAVHVRRGDYVSNSSVLKKHGLCSAQYYEEALKLLARTNEDAHCFLFSDDPAWVREHFDTHGLPSTVVDMHGEAGAHHDMHLMSLCKHHVIANSSFSWWGAWLAQSGGMTIAPKQWFADSSMADRDPCPERWIRI